MTIETDSAKIVQGWLRAWLPSFDFSAAQVARAASALQRAGAAVGVCREDSLSPFHPGRAGYQERVVREAIEAELRALMPDTADAATAPRSALPTARAKAPWDLTPSKMILPLNVHTASPEELAALPGLGPSSAGRICDARRGDTRFADLNAVRRAAKISAKTFERTAPLFTLGSPDREKAVLSLSRQLQAGGLAAFVDAAGRGALKLPFTENTTPAALALDLINYATGQVEARRFRPRFWRPAPGELAWGQKARDRGAELRTAGTHAAQAAPVPGGAYWPLLRRILGNAKKRLWIQMFFFNVDEEGSPGAQIVELLKAARERGVEVRVILDDDLDGDLHGARLVNADAFSALRAADIPVRSTLPDVTAHTKAVLADDRHVLVGSHNWTASSFYRYQDLSIYVESRRLAADLTARFTRRWTQFGPPGEATIAIEALDLFNQTERQALQAEAVTDDKTLASRTRLAASRRPLTAATGITEERLIHARKVVRLMKTFRISETTAVALAARGLDAPSEVKRAAYARLAAALDDLSDLPPPFHLRRLPDGVANYLWRF